MGESGREERREREKEKKEGRGKKKRRRKGGERKREEGWGEKKRKRVAQWGGNTVEYPVMICELENVPRYFLCCLRKLQPMTMTGLTWRRKQYKCKTAQEVVCSTGSGHRTGSVCRTGSISRTGTVRGTGSTLQCRKCSAQLKMKCNTGSATHTEETIIENTPGTEHQPMHLV